MTTDEELQSAIERLESEREQLQEREGEHDPTQAQDAARLEEIRVELDRLWDLKRQRNALREAGRNPDDAQERPAQIVEHYQQ